MIVIYSTISIACIHACNKKCSRITYSVRRTYEL